MENTSQSSIAEVLETLNKTTLINTFSNYN